MTPSIEYALYKVVQKIQLINDFCYINCENLNKKFTYHILGILVNARGDLFLMFLQGIG